MGLFGAGPEPRNAEDIKRAQTRAKLDDANTSTRTNSLTMEELQRMREGK
jgi:hypothetical protein